MNTTTTDNDIVDVVTERLALVERLKAMDHTALRVIEDHGDASILNPLIGQTTAETIDKLCMVTCAMGEISGMMNSATGCAEALRILAEVAYGAAHYERMRLAGNSTPAATD